MRLFALAELCEISGGYLVWQWWRNGAALAVGALGAAVLILYGGPKPRGRGQEDSGVGVRVRSLWQIHALPEQLNGVMRKSVHCEQIEHPNSKRRT